MSTDGEITVEQLPSAKVFADEQFNCRGYIPPSDVVDLARNIDKNGLLQPITVQPWTRQPGKDWRIIVGHRRFAAMTLILKWESVPCLIKTGLSDIDALALNFIENKERKDLNIVQEARALERMKVAGMAQTEIAQRIGVPRPWVQVRFYVLDLPEDIQEEVAIGYINQAQIHELNKMSREDQYEAVRQIKDAKIRAGTKRLKVSVKAKKPNAKNLHAAKVQDEDAINAMLNHMMEVGGAGLHTRVLAWAAGNISAVDLLSDFKTYVNEDLGKRYEIPKEGLQGL